ncbi:DHH family phosphoesterase [Desulfovibrio psychrotolerans]|uniref:DHH family phosphoesterase n=1 Tax=Desulfovibrio psychrotolerans TaxID=415242 RepID=A0A7J0BX53_9BACT|nr:phosphoesterase [Desulfovibrio psychrotolerans]GFM37752.1 DHH family phosphoesterase [Desulfovibrio psychrotolerans]
MSYFRKLEPGLSNLMELFSRDERWLIVVNADPDAMASAMALKRIMIHRVADVGIARVNEVTRPDNLAMIRYLRIPMMKLTPAVIAQYDRFALVDSQPHHHPLFKEMHFSVVFDHHPLSAEHPVVVDFKDIKPEYGANSSLMTEYLYNLGIRPGNRLATALVYGIKTDTNSFEREFCDIDVRAFRYLSKLSSQLLLSRISRSEYHFGWLDYFARGVSSMHKVRTGYFTYIGEVPNPDALVVIADFFMRVHEIRWIAVAGVSEDKLVIIFRGDGVTRDLGRFASMQFGQVGSAGGHKAMARAEIPLEKLEGKDAEMYVFKRLLMPRQRTRQEKAAPDLKSDPEQKSDLEKKSGPEQKSGTNQKSPPESTSVPAMKSGSDQRSGEK